MTYIHGQSKAAHITQILTEAEAHKSAAQARAAQLEAELFEAKASDLQAELDELNAARRRAMGLYPIDPDWYQHRQTLDAEVTAFNRERREAKQAILRPVPAHGVAA